MRRLLTLALALPLVFGSGCFVFEEIDEGMKIMEAHTPEANKKKQQAAAAAAATPGGKPSPSYNQMVTEWWKDATTLSTEPSPEVAADPLIPCKHAGKTVYTKRSDCLARGGQPG